MNKKEMVNALQSDLMKLAQAFVDNKPQNKPWGTEKKEFSHYNDQFTRLIGKLTLDFYLEECDSKYIVEILELSNDIKNKIDSLKSHKI